MMRLPLIVVLIAAPFGSLALAQGAAKSESPKAVQRLNRAPVSKDILKVKLPRPQIQQLPNGLTLMVVEQHKLPTVHASLWVKSGPLSDPKDLPGLALFTAEMLREGTKTRTSAQLAAAVDELGASLEASAAFGSELSVVSASGLVEDADRLLDLLADMALRPAFAPEELDKYKKRQLADLEEQRSNPQYLGRERFYAAVYRDAAPSVISPTPRGVNAVSVKDLAEFHGKHYLPDNAILGIAGDVTMDQVLPLVSKHLGAWAGKTSSPAKPPALPDPPKRRVLIVDRPGSVQTEIVVGDRSLMRTSPDFIPLTVTNRVLGGGPSARLFLQLREEKGYTYGAYSGVSADIYPGVFSARLAVRNEVTEPAMKDLLAEFEKVREQPVPEEELDESRRAIVANYALSLERPATLLNLWMSARYYGLPDDYWDRYAEQVARTTAAEVQKAAGKYVDMDRLQIVCVGDAKKIRPVLEQFGPHVEVYDTEGKRKDLVDIVP